MSRFVFLAKCLFISCICPFTLVGQDDDKANMIIHAYMKDVYEQIGKSPRKLGSQEAILKKFHELGEKHLLANKEVLHKKAGKDYLKLNTWQPPKDTKLVSRREEMKQLEEVEDIFKGGYGVPPFGRHTFATMWWEPVFAAKTIRDTSFRLNLSDQEYEKRKFVEQFAAPRIYRQSDNPEKPIVAFFDGNELFVARLKYIKVGIYALEKIEWHRVVQTK